MSIETVSKTFAFILEHGDLTESILFAPEEIPELKAEEREAIDSVSLHIKNSYVDLLTACRQALLDAAGPAPNRSTLERNKNKADTVWARGSTTVPLLIRSAWEAWVTFALWNTSEPGRPIKLFANIQTQRRYFPILSALAHERKLDLRAGECACRMGRILPREGDAFSRIAAELAAEVWPVASELYDRITRRTAVNAAREILADTSSPPLHREIAADILAAVGEKAAPQPTNEGSRHIGTPAK